MIHKVFYTDRIIPKRFGGVLMAPFPIILIRPKYRDDEGLLQHELQHLKDMYAGWIILYCIRYFFSKKWRLHYELRGYWTQLEYSPQHIRLFAYFLATKYRLGIDEDKAYSLLMYSDRSRDVRSQREGSGDL